MTKPMNRPVAPIYLDYQASTPCDPRVVDAMIPYFSGTFGNPHSVDHRHGWEAEEAVETARGRIAALIGAKPREIVFTSGATEANNLAIKGAALKRREAEGRRRVVTVASEHKCVLESVAWLAAQGFETTVLPVQGNGLVDLDQLEATLGEDVALLSVMAVNNEIGVIQPLAQIGEQARASGVWLHSDAAQGFGKIPLDVRVLSLDLMSITGHKIYGPKGIGALYIRGRSPKVELVPMMSGGGQERGIRSGTLPVPLCVGLGVAAEIAGREMEDEKERITGLRDRLWSRLSAANAALTINGDMENRLPGNLSITVPGLESSEVLASLDGLSVSAGSACSSGAQAGSHVLQALGLDPGKVAAGIRIGIGRFTTEEEIDAAAGMLIEALRT